MSYRISNFPKLRDDASREVLIGRLLLEQRKLTSDEVETVLHIHKDRGIKFGEAALQLGLVTLKDIEKVLALQFHYTYLEPGEGQFSPDLVAAYQPFSERTETLRGIRSHLMHRWFGTGQKSLTISGIDSDIGVGSFAANLAVVFSQLGLDTLLVDANLRLPTQQEIFNTVQREGLSDLLVERAGMQVIREIESLSTLSVLTAGTVPPNPQELLSRLQFGDLTSWAESKYDIVLYTAPALSIAADALSVIRKTRGVMLVAQKDITRVVQIKHIGEQIIRSGAQIVGSVLLDI